jgi:hypothetical protein
MRPLLVGLMPNKGGDGYPPLSGTPSLRLSRWMGLERCNDRSILQDFNTVNLNLLHGDRLDLMEALHTKDRVLALNRGEPIVMCGRIVADVFGMGDDGFWEWRGNQVVIPHPSGRTRTYNLPGARSATGRILREALKWARGT